VPTLLIKLPDLRGPDWRALYVGDRPRYATATSVRILNESTLVCCSLLARKIYLVHFDLAVGSSRVLSSADTVYAGRSTETDLCDSDADGCVVITSNCEGGNMSLYRRVGDEIRHDRDLSTGLAGNFCHGARFCGPGAVAAATVRDPRGVHVFERSSMRRLLYVATDRLAKDVCFLPGGRAAIATTDGAPATVRTHDRRSSEVLVVEFDLGRGSHRVVARQLYDAGQIDSIVAHGDNLFAVDSPGGRVLVIDARTLRQVDQIDGYDFPHGVDVNHGAMAVACYGTNSIHLKSL